MSIGFNLVMSTKVSLLLTGSELMNGDVIDTNSVMFAEQLNDIGLTIAKKVTIGDDQQLLLLEIIQLSKESDLLIINGGLGPTVDDLTAQVLAEACNVELTLNTDAHQHLKRWAIKRQTPLNEPNLKQAYLPSNCSIVANKTGSAVGFSVTLNQCLVICTPGVPSELAHMLNDEIKPTLTTTFPPQEHIEIARLQLFGIGESTLQALLNDKLPDWPKELEIGFRAASSLLELKLIAHSPEGNKLLPQWSAKVHHLLGDHILASGESAKHTLADYLVPLLVASGQKITTAESCTGGLIASQITAISGSSAVFEAGFVTYSNEMKNKMLDVPSATIADHGAVSKETVLAMAKGALNKANADYVIAVSGIAGPNGGSKEKPLGSVWIAWGNKQHISAKYYCITTQRKHFQRIVAARSLDLVRRLVINSNERPNYDQKS